MSSDSARLDEFDPELKVDRSGRSTFRIRNMKFLLVYPSHINRTDLENFLRTIGKFNKCYIGFCNADDAYKYETTRVVIEYTEQILDQTKKAPHKFCFPGTSCHIRDDGSKPHCGKCHPYLKTLGRSKDVWKDALTYISCNDKDCADEIKNNKSPGGKNCVGDHVNSAKSVVDLVYNLPSFGMVNGAIAAYDTIRSADTWGTIDDFKLEYKWQSTLIQLIEDDQVFNKTTVVWVYDTVGLTGKSTFAEHMVRRHPNNIIVNNNLSTMSNFATFIESCKKGGWTGEMLIVDIPRSQKKLSYDALVICKSGRFTVTKYRGRQLTMQPCKVLVFSNNLPDYSQLAIQRWKVFRIEDEELIEEQVPTVVSTHVRTITNL